MPTALNNTLTKLASVTLGSGQTTISFTAIPQTYTDLVVKFSINSASNNQYIRFNNSSAAIYQLNTLRGNGSAADNYVTGANQTELYFMASGIAANTFGSAELYIANYTSAIFKSCFLNAVGEANTATVYSNQIASSWNSTSAINQIDIVCASGLGQYSSATLYGINPVKTQALATGGDVITTDGTYWYHAFRSSGTFTPSITLSCDYLVVAGGGGTGTDFTSGAGAGGYRSATTQSISTAQTITVGAGGSGGSGGGGGTSGSNSSLGAFSATGGGRSGTTGAAGVTGGSGSGAPIGSAQSGAAGNAGGYSPVEGYKGGDGTGSGVPRSTGGGGGAGAVGGNGNNSGNGGAGGFGSNAHSSWLSVTGLGVLGYLAGGGGGTGESLGSIGGVGGGGTGGNQGNGALGKGTDGIVNTGSGGGGGGNGGGNGSAGGSGLVIIRYAMA
jgi:hypothetical protein